MSLLQGQLEKDLFVQEIPYALVIHVFHEQVADHARAACYALGML